MPSYDELIDLLIELAMERENDSHMDKICASICEGKPLLRGILEGGLLNPTLTLVRVVDGMNHSTLT